MILPFARVHYGEATYPLTWEESTRLTHCTLVWRVLRESDERIAAQKADRASQSKRRRFWGILTATAALVTVLGLGYLIGIEGKRAFGLAAFVGLSGLGSALVWGVWEIESEEE